MDFAIAGSALDIPLYLLQFGGRYMGSSAQAFILLPLLLNQSSYALLIPYLPAIGFGLLTHPTFTGAARLRFVW